MFTFPNFSQAYPSLSKRSLFKKLPKYLRYGIFSIQHQRTIQAFTQWVNQHPLLQSLLINNHKMGSAVFQGYMLRQHSVKQRFECIQTDLQFALTHFPQSLFENKTLTLVSLEEDIQITLEPNPLNWQEGMWAVCLYYQSVRIYLLTFSLCDKHSLLIGSLQGTNHQDSQSLIKKLTKHMHGLRPQQLMVFLALALSKQWHLNEVNALSLINHPRMTIRKRLLNKTMFIADYEKIWSSYQGEKLANNNWQIPAMHLKPLADIASKKRSMYRKRYTMLDEITADIEKCFNKVLEK